VEFRVLGPLELLEDGQAVELPGGKPRALLGQLLPEAGSVVSVDRIIDCLWGRHAPATAAKVVQGYVSPMPKLLPPAALETQLGRDRFDVLAREGSKLRLDEAIAVAIDLTRKGRPGHRDSDHVSTASDGG
jgi:DNA-binding SARP family transcriptional activator